MDTNCHLRFHKNVFLLISLKTIIPFFQYQFSSSSGAISYETVLKKINSAGRQSRVCSGPFPPCLSKFNGLTIISFSSFWCRFTPNNCWFFVWLLSVDLHALPISINHLCFWTTSCQKQIIIIGDVSLANWF